MSMAPRKRPIRDYSDFKALRSFAMDYAYYRGVQNEQTREDFAQEYCLAVWLGQSRDVRIQLTNFMRGLYGRNDKHARPGQLAKSYALMTMMSYEDLFVD